MIPSIPWIMSAPFQPAIAIYSIAWPASDAENCVVAPICLAFASNMFIDVSVALEPSLKASPISLAAFTTAARSSFATFPEMAATVDIWASNSFPTLVEAATTPAIAVPAAAIPAAVSFAAPPATLPSVAICLFTFPMALPKDEAILPAISTVNSC